LYQTVNTHYGEFVATAKSTGDLHARVGDVARAVHALAAQVDGAYVCMLSSVVTRWRTHVAAPAQATLTERAIAPALELEHVKTQLATSDLLVTVLGQLAQVRRHGMDRRGGAGRQAHDGVCGA
jgi:hypothetical protein